MADPVPTTRTVDLVFLHGFLGDPEEWQPV
ncbi:2-succinyl-6-hydroxy-2,4-cyclohexadiene-1-carboxylate synthase, partial [Halorhodospira halophila]|nr:2-succinyl-6-hydroxy-2,4-cyclohexadiene-1-carboxylate synthase [Halorhodospira halophila]